MQIVRQAEGVQIYEQEVHVFEEWHSPTKLTSITELPPRVSDRVDEKPSSTMSYLPLSIAENINFSEEPEEHPYLIK